MLHTTQMMERSLPPRNRRQNSMRHKSTSPPPMSVREDAVPPKKQIAAPKVLPLREPRETKRSDRMMTWNTNTEETAAETRPQARSDRLSERFGQIIKQRPGRSRDPAIEPAKENTNSSNTAAFPSSVDSRRQKPELIRIEPEEPPEPLKLPESVRNTAELRHSPAATRLTQPAFEDRGHLNMLLEKSEKKGIREPFDRFVYTILRKGRADFEARCRRLHRGPSVYQSAQREFEAVLSKGEGETTEEKARFTQRAMMDLVGKAEEGRWFQLYLAKILCKKALVPRIKYA